MASDQASTLAKVRILGGTQVLSFSQQPILLTAEGISAFVLKGGNLASAPQHLPHSFCLTGFRIALTTPHSRLGHR